MCIKIMRVQFEGKSDHSNRGQGDTLKVASACVFLLLAGAVKVVNCHCSLQTETAQTSDDLCPT